MINPFKLDNPVRDFYGDREYTYRDKLESGEMEIVKENNLSTNFKDKYYVTATGGGFLKYLVDGREAKKYLKDQQTSAIKTATSNVVKQSQKSNLMSKRLSTVDLYKSIGKHK